MNMKPDGIWGRDVDENEKPISHEILWTEISLNPK